MNENITLRISEDEYKNIQITGIRSAEVQVESLETNISMALADSSFHKLLEINVDEGINVTPSVSMGERSDVPDYTGAYTVVPKAYSETKLKTKNKRMYDDVTVTEVPYYETSNPDGTTIYIAQEIEVHGN